ncbi:hypothetical protein DTO027I6_5923 [Penicillium roqueforti]|uniref:uncharacterized protein n=1 Tax=Penicillium roqueforti TaxID=5082 RepID=UPI00190D42BF|nr:uncharacterized protein LCP9604111_1015 [Penicillium roqueforti]KAF9253489.1 hypothetical protein LCP9604111_1015 [Penicillium roqueforti]KAI2680668.1 hypothetical protein CBS147355_3648 [Penicillium roqueforti]KAI2690943.1 hypothetical protein LCP963914a_1144 [Penicillium roqueforti]KAI2723736.1 hypothetical protein CBS147318_667 [Penicillium roqueforti]KAI2728432.1 hypothetical protein CBS147354_2352 [Penicillium roqueforti]
MPRTVSGWQGGFVHTDVKQDNILVNYGTEVEGVSFTDVQLADFGSTIPATSKYAYDENLIGAPIWRSPEAHLRIGWGISTDIWSFGTMLITLIYGDNYFMFKPDVSADHDEYDHKIPTRQYAEKTPHLEEPSLPPEYGMLPADKKFEADELQRRRLISYYYRIFNGHLNKAHLEALRDPILFPRQHLVDRAGRQWSGNLMTLKGALVLMADYWPHLSDIGIPCPVRFTDAELDGFYE